MRIKKTFVSLLAILLVVVSLFLLKNEKIKISEIPRPTENTISTEEATVKAGDFEKVTLLRVVDGDTMIFKKTNGEKVRVRLIGVNCPESVHPDENKNTQEGKEASNFSKQYLKPNETYYLEYDKDKTDKYDRTLAYLWLKDCSQNITRKNIENYMYNAILLKEKQAEIMKIEPNTKYASIFEKIEKSC